MGIRVKHEVGGGDIAAMVALAAAAGLGQAQGPQAPIAPVGPMGAPPISGGGGGGRSMFESADRAKALSARRAEQMREIDARADRDRQAADDAMKKTALAAGLQGEMQEQEYDREIKKMQEQAKVDAGKLDYKFSAEQKRDIAKNNRAKATVRKLVADGDWTPEEGKVALDKIGQLDAGLTPGAYPADERKQPPPQEQTWTAPNGDFMGVDSRGNPRILTPWKNSKEGLEHQAGIAKQEQDDKAYDDRLNRVLDMTVEKEVDGMMEKVSLEPYEVDDAMNRWQEARDRHEAMRNQGLSGPQQGEVNRRNEEARENAKRKWDEQHGVTQQQDWVSKLEKTGIKEFGLDIPIKVSEEHAELGPQLGALLALFDAIDKKYDGDFKKIPARLRPYYKKLIPIANAYYDR